MQTKLLVILKHTFLDTRAILKPFNLHSDLQFSSRRSFLHTNGYSAHSRPAANENVLAEFQKRSPAIRHSKRSYSFNNWQNNTQNRDAQRKTVPKLLYLQNPLKYFVTKMNLWKFRLLWDRNFREDDFIRGAKQAVIVVTDIIRNQHTHKISKFTTPIGFQQITNDMLLSRNDSRLKLVNFETEHIRRAIPIKVATRKKSGRRYCFVDMLFVGLRNTKDFESPQDLVEINATLRQLDADTRTPIEIMSVPHRIVFAEIFMRFRRDYSVQNNDSDSANSVAGNGQWSVSFYKIITFDVLNYDPKT